MSSFRQVLKKLWLTSLVLATLLSAPVYAQNSDQKLNTPYFDNTPEVVVCGSGSLVGSTNAIQAFNFFVSKGYQPYQAAGIVGNMMYESGVLPQRLQGTPSDQATPAETLTPAQLSDGTLGWGIVQFTPPGKFINTFTNKVEANGLQTQLEFVWNQLEGGTEIPEKRAGDEIKATTSLEEAVKAFQGTLGAGGQYYGYERPADQSGTIPDRTRNAIQVLAEAGSGGSTATSGGCGGLSAANCPTEPIEESETVTVVGIQVHPCISTEVERIVTLAREQGLDLSGGGYRTLDGQIEARRNNCGTSTYDIYDKPAGQCSPPTAKPGNSRHQSGAAVDFTCDGGVIPSRSHPCYTFLDNNTSLINLPSEEWHWSDNGS